MTKNEYLSELRSELKKNNVIDMEDIVSEYEQHFAFKLADGYSEEEIAAKLGVPKTIAAQFDGAKTDGKKKTGGGFFLKLGLACMAFFEALFYILFLVWDVVLAVTTVAITGLGIYLIGNFDIFIFMPNMPYIGSLMLGVSIIGFAVIFGVATVYCFAFLRQMIRANSRWHKNKLSANSLPPLPWSPQFAPKTRRTLRTVLLAAVAIFGVSFVLSYIVMAVAAGALEFWHVWGWFVS